MTVFEKLRSVHLTHVFFGWSPQQSCTQKEFHLYNGFDKSKELLLFLPLVVRIYIRCVKIIIKRSVIDKKKYVIDKEKKKGEQKKNS